MEIQEKHNNLLALQILESVWTIIHFYILGFAIKLGPPPPPPFFFDPWVNAPVHKFSFTALIHDNIGSLSRPLFWQEYRNGSRVVLCTPFVSM